MTSNQIWVFLATTAQQSPWIIILLGFGVLALPGILLSLLAAIEHFMTPKAYRKPFGHRLKGMEMDGPLLQFYYKTVGAAAILLMAVTLVYHALAPAKSFLFGW